MSYRMNLSRCLRRTKRRFDNFYAKITAPGNLADRRHPSSNEVWQAKRPIGRKTTSKWSFHSFSITYFLCYREPDTKTIEKPYIRRPSFERSLVKQTARGAWP
jgi:hypothetical protein